METEIIQESELDRAIEWVNRGEPIVFPTETVYGLGARLYASHGIHQIFTIKNRPLDNPLIIHAESVEQAAALGEASTLFFKLAEAFWPGPLTMVIPRREGVPSSVSSKYPTIALRVPSHPIAQKLLLAVGEPIAAPSANLSGRPSATLALDAAEDLRGKVRFIVDGGASLIGIESTVIRLIEDRVILLRPGPVLIEELEAVLGKTVEIPSASEPIVSPGMKYRHYAPKAMIRMVENAQELQGDFILSLHPKEGQFLLSSHTLYAAFREADRRGVKEIMIDSTPSLRQDLGLMNRLLKAASL